jgi:HK97 gp10 family phage protein
MSLKITGAKDIERLLYKLPAQMQNRAESTILRQGAKPILKAAKSKAPKGPTGLLKKSMGVTVKKVKGVRSARVGPRNGFIQTKMVKRRKTGEIESQDINPVFYAHLVELGSSRQVAKPFIRPAIDSSKSEVLTGMAKGYERALTNEVRRLRKKR